MAPADVTAEAFGAIKARSPLSRHFSDHTGAQVVEVHKIGKIGIASG